MMTRDAEPSYRRTEAGVIPTDWEVARLRELVSMMTNGFVGLSKMHYVDDRHGVIYIQGFNVTDGGFNFSGIKHVSHSFHSQHQKSSLRAGDMLTIQTGDVGLSTVVAPKLAGANCHALIITRFKAVRANPNFYMRLFNSDAGRQSLRAIETGTTMKHLNVGDMLEFFVPVPPIAEQSAIVEAVDDVSDLIGSIERKIAKKQAIKQGMMQQLITGRTRLPGFADPWKARRISDFAEVRAGGTPSTSIARYWGGTVRWMSSGEIHSKRVDEVQGRITAEGLRESSAQLLPVGTVLMALAGQGKTRGTVAVSRIELSTNQSIAGILPGGEHNPSFLYYNLDTRYLELRGESAGEGGRGGLNLTIIKKLEVLMPNVVEQQAIAKVLTAIDDEIDALERRLVSTRRIKQGMMQELLSGRTRLKPAEVAA
ncbi:restriction endonuclease subunit S [Rhodoglobus sp.]